MRSSTACAFEFRKHCLFCPNGTTCKLLHEYDDKVPHQYRIPASLVTTDKIADAKKTYKEWLLDICQKRGDDLGKTVGAGIHGSPSDLHAADARYHRKCNQSFHHDAHRPNETGDKYSVDDCAFSETVNVLSSDRSKRTDFTTHSQSKLQPLLKGRNVYLLVRVQSYIKRPYMPVWSAY